MDSVKDYMTKNIYEKRDRKEKTDIMVEITEKSILTDPNVG